MTTAKVKTSLFATRHAPNNNLIGRVAEQSEDRIAYDVREACAMLGIGLNSFYEAVRSGKLKAKKLGAKTLVLRDDIKEFARSLPDLRLAKKAPGA